MDLGEAAVRFVGAVDPRAGARLAWQRRVRRGDPEALVVEALVRPGDVAVDIGANVGVFTARLADLVGPTGQVHAFEPNPVLARTLRAVRAGRSHVVLHNVALSDGPGEAVLHIPVVPDERASTRAVRRLGALVGTTGPRFMRISAVASLSVPGNSGSGSGSGSDNGSVLHETVRVPLARLDDLLPTSRPVAFVKCDVEGHEPQALRGAQGTLRQWRPTLLVEIEQRHHPDQPIHSVFQDLLGLGYAGYALFPDGLRPLAAFDVQRDQQAYLSDTFALQAMPAGYINNFLFVRPDSDLSPLQVAR